MSVRSLSQVPRVVLVIFAAALSTQVGWKALSPPPIAEARDLEPAPGIGALRLASLGDPIAAAKILMLYLQAFDYQSGSRIPYRELDYARLEDWLSRVLELDPTGQYPLFAASRLYAEVPVESKQRRMLEFVYARFFADPDRRWPWLAHAASIAKYRLKDLALARRYAAAIQRYATGKDVPLWARQMEIFILEDMGELEAARIMIGGYVNSGAVHDVGELRFLEDRLKALEEREKAAKP